MAADIRALFVVAQAAERPPPLGSLVQDALRHGRRLRRRRKLIACAVAVAAIAAVVAVAVAW
jgi:hypothetical protein